MRWIAAVAICLVVASPAWADWGVRRDPFDQGVVRRYKAILTKDPHDPGALRALTGMYQRYRTVAALEQEYRKQLDAGEDWATLVVLARMPRTNRTDTLALWNRAVKAKPDDPRGWIALGDVAPDAAASRDAYRRAVKLAITPKDKRAALTKLVGAARSAGDTATLDAAYTQLIELAPKDGLLWLDRGSAQLAANKPQPALDSFITAEALFKTDPERRLTAMTNQGLALEKLGRIDDAIAQYVKTLDKMPRGYFLGGEVVMRIIDTERKRKQIGNAVVLLEKRWPEKTRGYFEWDVLGDLYKEQGLDEGAISAYRHAVTKAPTEVVTQRKLIALLDKLERPNEALAQHELAARVAPGDADLQIELAKRYQPMDVTKATTVLEKLSKRFARNVNVRKTIAALYDQWELPLKAIVEYEAIQTLEPADPEHAVVLGDAYWQTNQPEKARASWDRLAKINTPASLYRHGEVLAQHELWQDAADAYTKSLALDGTLPDTYRGRAAAYDALGKFPDATSDAKRAVALIGNASREDGNRERYLLVRVLGHWYQTGTSSELPNDVARWRYAFDHGDINAGYLLVAHHSRIASPQHHDTLVALYKRVPTDDSLGMALARSYAARQDFDAARSTYEGVLKRTPKRAEEITKLLAQLDTDRIKAEEEAKWEEEGLSVSERQLRRANGRGPDITGEHRRFGFRFELGSDVRQASGALLGLGLYRTHGIAPGTAFVTRFDWTQRDDEMEEVNAVAVSLGLQRRLLDTRRFEVTVSAAARFELRFFSDNNTTSWDRGAIAGDAALELLPRAMPATLGLRFNHELTDAPHSSALLLELGFELR